MKTADVEMWIQAGVVGWRRAHTDIMGELPSSAYIYHCIGDNYLEQSVSHMFGASGVFVGPGHLHYCFFLHWHEGTYESIFFCSYTYMHIYKYSKHIYIHAKPYENAECCLVRQPWLSNARLPTRSKMSDLIYEF